MKTDRVANCPTLNGGQSVYATRASRLNETSWLEAGSATSPSTGLHGARICDALCSRLLGNSRPGVNPFDKPLDTLGALSLSKRLRASDPGYKFPSVAGKTAFCVFGFCETDRPAHAPSICRNSSSLRTGTPSDRAFSSFDPASSPAST